MLLFYKMSKQLLCPNQDFTPQLPLMAPKKGTTVGFIPHAESYEKMSSVFLEKADKGRTVCKSRDFW